MFFCGLFRTAGIEQQKPQLAARAGQLQPGKELARQIVPPLRYSRLELDCFKVVDL